MQTVRFGASPTPFLAFLSPRTPSNGWLWSIDQSCLPTVNDKSLGSNMWGGSRTGAGLYEGTLGRGRAGQQHLSLCGTPGFGGVRYSTFLTQPFVTYNFGEG